MSGSAAAPLRSAADMDKAPVIEADRVRLVPLGLADAAAIVQGHRPDGVRWADGYPTDRTLLAAGLVVTAEGQTGSGLGPYPSYQIVRRDDGMVIGDCGFLGPPDADGEVHVGFGVADGEHGRRHAADALRALIAWARERPEVGRIRADAGRTDIAAMRVLQSAGMRRSGADAGLVYYEA